MNHPAWRVLLALGVFAAQVASLPVRAAQPDRLINISSRTQVGTGADVMIAGFIVGTGSPKRVLIRGIGPTLTQFNVGSVLNDPLLTLHDGAGNVIATSDNWSATDAATMASVGAFALPAGSRDAVLVQTLNPGAYTAVVEGVGATNGVGMVEVYEIDGTSRLINISTRARVGTDANVLISGLIVGPSANKRRILIRAMGPTLTKFGISDPLLDPLLTLHEGSGAVIASNDNWESPDAASVINAEAQAGATAFPSGSKDAALVVDLAPGAYTAQIEGVNRSVGVALLEAYDISPGINNAQPSVSVTASISATAPNSFPGEFTFTRTGDLSAPLTENFTLSGTAGSGDFISIGNSITFPAGSDTVKIAIAANATALTGQKSVIVTLSPVNGYQLGVSSAQVTIFYGAGTLYVANLRASSTATTSTGYGTSTLTLSPDESAVTVNISYANLTSPATSVYVRLRNDGGEGPYLVKLPIGQSGSIVWRIKDTGGYTAAQIVAAIKAGNVYVNVGTTNFPSGELLGSYLAGAGSQNFTPPTAPPALPNGAPSAPDAARFLMQATFGPTPSDIDAVVQKGFSRWISDQIGLAATSHRAATVDDFTTFNTNADATKPGASNRLAAWWKIAVTAPDQLRQRTAFALSELFVISDQNGNVANWEEGAANFYDLLAKDAFGNFRTLLEDVTLSPMMGVYLSHIKNSKATATTEPDENYAREVMQLFTIGLNQLQPDGTLKLDVSGQPIPTYDQKTVSETAKVFTGWQFNNASPTKRNFRSGGDKIDDYIQPMTLNPNFHDDGTKTIVGGAQLPAGQGGAKDLKDELDALFNHPNTGPFVCRQLIQRLVTSNPSPAYVYRVSQVFANNGSGVRGDLSAVVRAILLDYEARSATAASSQNFGKLKEPVLRMTALLRAFAGASDNGRYNLSTNSSFSQSALQSPTVFNFFEPSYVVPGDLAASGLVGPEFQILTDTTAISAPNTYYNLINATRAEKTIGLDFTNVPAPAQPAALVDYLNLVLCANTMPTTMRDRIVTALNAMPAKTADLDKIRAAVYLVSSTQYAAVQK